VTPIRDIRTARRVRVEAADAHAAFADLLGLLARVDAVDRARQLGAIDALLDAGRYTAAMKLIEAIRMSLGVDQ
jgi:hypothetical protein